MTVNPRDFLRYFKGSEEEEGQQRRVVLEEASQVIAFAMLPYYERYVAWLEREANKPLPIGDHMEMVKVAVRSNTLREVKEHLIREVRSARATVTAEREG